MIVNYKADGWEVITQRAHGILAAQVAFQWKKAERPARWLETLLAIAEHDDAEVELDGENLLTEAGGPLNFDMKVFDPEHCAKLSILTQTKSRYIALLTSYHMEFLYRKDAAKSSDARAFLQHQQQFRQQCLKSLELTEKASLQIYALVEWCDAFSLLLSQQSMQPESREVEISTGPSGSMYFLKQASDGRLSVRPWPFEVRSFEVTLEYRSIGQLSFSSSAEFRKAFLAAPVNEKTFRIEKMSHRSRPAKVSR